MAPEEVGEEGRLCLLSGLPLCLIGLPLREIAKLRLDGLDGHGSLLDGGEEDAGTEPTSVLVEIRVERVERVESVE